MTPASELTAAECAAVLARRLASWASFAADGIRALLAGRQPTLYLAERMPPRDPDTACTFVQTAVQPSWRTTVEREAGSAERHGRRLPDMRGLVWDNGPEGGRIVCPGNFGRMRIVGPAETINAAALPFGLVVLQRIWDLTPAEERSVLRSLEQQGGGR